MREAGQRPLRSARCTRRDLLRGGLLLGASLVPIPRRADAREPGPPGLSSAAQRAVARLADWTRGQKVRLGASVLEAATGRVLAESAPDDLLNPASNQKILTMAAALDRLGPAHRFVTRLHEGIAGDPSTLVLRGDGDPELSLAGLLELLEQVLARGRASVGDIIVDQSAFDASWEPPRYQSHPKEWAAYRAPVSAVAVDGNRVVMHVEAARQGQRAHVWFEPPGLVEVRGSVTTAARTGPSAVRLSLTPKGDLLEAAVGGTVPEGAAPQSFARRIASPERAPGHVLSALFARRGVTVAGKVKSGAPEVQGARVSLESRPLAELIRAMGKQSDNFVAEMLLKALGARATGQPGSSQAGAAAVGSFLRRLGPLDPKTRLENGSGLYDANRVSAALLTRVLGAALGDPRIGPELLPALAIGGVDGTLVRRFRAQAKRRSIRAKTGTLSGVTALSGYVLRPDGPIAFSFLVNGAGLVQHEVRARLDAAVAALDAA